MIDSEARRPVGRFAHLRDSAVLLLCARVVLGGVFVGLAIAKARDPVAFMKAVRLYDMVPDGSVLLNLIAALLPWVELVCGALLIAGVGVRGNAMILLALLLAFTPAIALRASEIARTTGTAFWDVAFDCGCGTGVERVAIKLPENVGLALLASFALVSRARRYCLRRDLI